MKCLNCGSELTTAGCPNCQYWCTGYTPIGTQFGYAINEIPYTPDGIKFSDFTPPPETELSKSIREKAKVISLAWRHYLEVCEIAEQAPVDYDLFMKKLMEKYK